MFIFLEHVFLFLLGAAISSVYGEVHTVRFQNKCGSGKPMLLQGGRTLSTGDDYTVWGPLISGIAYLQIGECGFNGEGCTLVEFTLKNPDPDLYGSGSSADISLIDPHIFSVPSGFYYDSGCTYGANCDNANCPMAFRVPDDTQVQVASQENDVNLVITFC